MKIHVRIPTVQYGYLEPVYDSIEEYEEKHLDFYKAYTKMQKEIKEYQSKEEPF